MGKHKIDKTMNAHTYIKYAIGLLMEEYGLKDEQSITFAEIKEELAKGTAAFSVKPIEDYTGKTEVKFGFTSDKNNAKSYVFLSPNCITSEMKAANLYSSIKKIYEEKYIDLSKPYKVSQSDMPTAGEFNAFSDKGNISRGKASSTVLHQCLALITSTTPLKPCLQYRSGAGKVTTDNVCLIPDVALDDLVNFIKLFKRIRIQKLDSSLMTGKVKAVDGKVVKYEPKRPNIFNGNFPNAPRSSALGIIALLGSIGEMTKEADTSVLAYKVLESLKNANFYMFKYGDAKVFSYNNYVIDIAAQGKLRQIVDSMYYVVLYNQGKRATSNSFEYQKFDLFASRFMQMFTRPAFKDFLSFRAEYPSELELLLSVYFNSMEKINEEIVKSAKALGRWLNMVAYFSAKDIADSSSWDDIRKAKAKILVELESSIFSAKSGDSLIAHTIARAGRLSGLDAPEAATLFMEKATSGQLPLEQAKNLLIAFSRLRFNNDTDNNVSANDLRSNVGQETSEDLSDI